MHRLINLIKIRLITTGRGFQVGLIEFCDVIKRWKTKKEKYIFCENYDSIEGTNTSDHKPIVADFHLFLEKKVEEKLDNTKSKTCGIF